MSRASSASYSCAINIDCGHAFSTSPDPFIIVAGHARDVIVIVIVGGGGDSIVWEGVCVDLAFFLMRPFHRVTVDRDLEVLYRADHIASQLQEALSSRTGTGTVTVTVNSNGIQKQIAKGRTGPDRALELPAELRRSSPRGRRPRRRSSSGPKESSPTRT